MGVVKVEGQGVLVTVGVVVGLLALCRWLGGHVVLACVLSHPLGQ